jgi:hypothetical protein
VLEAHDQAAALALAVLERQDAGCELAAALARELATRLARAEDPETCALIERAIAWR